MAMLGLDRNEYFFPHHPEVLAALRSSEESAFSRYARQQDTAAFCSDLAHALGVPSAKITLAHGAEDVLVKIFAWFKMRYQQLIIEEFSWTNYLHIAQGFGYNIQRVPTLHTATGFAFNNKVFTEYLSRSEPSLVLLTSPNNPTGHSIPDHELQNLIQAFPQHIFLLDNVYAHFFQTPALKLAYLENVIVIGSFSKFFGLPGLRIGFAVGLLPEAFSLNLGVQPFVLTACKAALANAEFYQANREYMLAYAASVQQKSFSGLSIYKTDAQFFLALLHDAAHKVTTAAENAAGIKPKYITKNSATYIRVSLGPAEICKKIDTYLSYFN